jgi:hypothetical protein
VEAGGIPGGGGTSRRRKTRGRVTSSYGLQHDEAGAAPEQGRTGQRKCRAGSAAGAAGRWTRAEEHPSGGRGPSAAFSLPLPSPALAVNDSRAVDFPREAAIWAGARSISRASPRRAVDFSRRGPFPAGPRSFGALSPRIGVRRLRRSSRRPPDAKFLLGDA